MRGAQRLLASSSLYLGFCKHKSAILPCHWCVWWVRARQMKRGVGLFNLSPGHIVLMGGTLKLWRFLHSRILGLNVQFRGGALA